MKTVIFCFSGTGNTLLCAKKWQEESIKNGISCDLVKMEDNEEVDIKEYDVIGVAYPIHGFNAPRIVLEFAKKLERLEEQKKAFIIMVSGEYMTLNHLSSFKLSKLLKKKNIIVDSEYHYLMPYNMIFRHTEKRAYEMYETMNKLVPIHLKDYLINKNKHTLKKQKLLVPFVFLVRIEQPFAPINGKLYKIDMDKCIKCMKCVDNCPRHNIKYENDKFIFGYKCMLCTRCSFSCPKDAIKIGILNGWRVNGKYKFSLSEKEEIDKHKKYCKKSYIKYFDEADKLINQNNSDI